jgi:hypothetical protein
LRLQLIAEAQPDGDLFRAGCLDNETRHLQ